MNPVVKHIVLDSLKTIITEQAAKEPISLETDNTKTSAGDSPFTAAEKKFLGKFDAYGTTTMGIIYSISDIGIREFIMRSGKDLNLTAQILLQLLHDGIIKIVPYTGWGRDDSYTIELQLPLEDIEGFGAEDKKKVEKGSEASGAPAAGGATPPAPEVSWTIKYGDLLKESAKIAKRLLLSNTIAESKQKNKISTVYVTKSRILKHLPKNYIDHLEQLIALLSKKQQTSAEKQQLIADILDNLHVNFKLTDKQIAKSYEMHKKQKRFEKFANKK